MARRKTSSACTTRAQVSGSRARTFVDVTVADVGGAWWAEAAGLRVKMPAALATRVRAQVGRRLTLGVRPEALLMANGADDYSFATAVDVVEPLGNEILLN